MHRMTRVVRDNKLLAAIIFFDTVGCLIALYTTYLHYFGFGALLCVGGHHGGPSSCQQVQTSRYSEVGGVPVALLGVIAYGTTLFANLGLRGEWARAYVFCVALIGFLFSIWLTSREAFVLHEYCEWCLGSAVAMTALAILTGIRFWRADP